VSTDTPTFYAHYSAGPAGPFQTIAVPVKVAPLWWQEKGLTYTRSGYGRRIPTAYMVQLPGSPRWRRVYVCVYSNAGTCYVEDTTQPKRIPEGGKVARYPWIVIRQG
jgi:hypothetical protein